jgi:hypothetical protein
VTEYDLRPLIDDLWIESREGAAYVLGMRLRSDSHATGRPDEVLEAMGLGDVPRSIERTRCLFENTEK